MSEPTKRARGRVRVMFHSAADRLGADAWFISVKTPDDCWTFVMSCDDERSAECAADTLVDALTAFAEAEAERCAQIAERAYKSAWRRHVGEKIAATIRASETGATP